MNFICSKPFCDKLAERNGICATHNFLARKAAKELLKPKKEIKPIAKRSEKKVKSDSEYTVLRKKFLEEYPMCNASVTDICTKVATQIHHTSISALNYLNTETWIGCCNDCHRVIETIMSAESRREKGLLTD